MDKFDEPSAPPPNYTSISLIKNTIPTISINDKIKNLYKNNLILLLFYVSSNDDIQNFIQLYNYLEFNNLESYNEYDDILKFKFTKELYLQICCEIAILYNSKLIVKKCIQLLGLNKMIQLCFNSIIYSNSYEESCIYRKYKDNVLNYDYKTYCDCCQHHQFNDCYYCKKDIKCKKYYNIYFIRKNIKIYDKLLMINFILNEINIIYDLELIIMILNYNDLSYNNFKKIENYQNYISILRNNFNFKILKQYYKEFPPTDENDIQFVKNNYNYLNNSCCIIS